MTATGCDRVGKRLGRFAAGFVVVVGTCLANQPAHALVELDGIAAIAAGHSHTCALTTSGGAKCWGKNDRGQLGDNSYVWRSTAVDVLGLGTGVAAIAAGYEHSCALTTTGIVKCWGQNGHGQLGDNTTIGRAAPVEVVGLGADVVAIAAGFLHTCALTSARGVKCWGAFTTPSGNPDPLGRSAS